jgi:hypothetical protein
LTGKFIDQKAKDELHNYQKALAKFPDFFDKDGNVRENTDLTKLPDEGKKTYQDYIDYQQKITKEMTDYLTDRTQTITKQRICYAPISGVARYFDTSTLVDKNFADNFAIDKTDGIAMNGDMLNMK